MRPHAWLLTVALAASVAPAQAQGAVSARNYAPDLPQLIRASQQVTLYAPVLGRADIAEAVRLSLLERGSRTLVLTTHAGLMTPNSLTFRLQLMGNDTYAVDVSSTPFIILDGRVYSGPGVTGAGRAALLPAAQGRAVINWAQRRVDTGTPLDLRQTMKEWTLKNLGITLTD